MNAQQAQELMLKVPAVDGYPLLARLWSAEQPGRTDIAPVVVINSATSVDSRYYSRFAAYLNAHGMHVITYDYRGIGGSRPDTLRGFDANWLDWGRLDCEGILRFAHRRFPRSPIHLAAHSIGGFILGLAPSCNLIDRVFTMGAQFAHWRDYAPEQRLGMLLRWHVTMPLLTRLFGYFPGRSLGWLEDTPKGVVQDWTARHPRFENAFIDGSRKLAAHDRQQIAQAFATLTADTLALSISDDPFGTIPAIQRQLAYFTHARKTHIHLAPKAIGETAIGHFAFFNDRYKDTLWHLPMLWLRHGTLADDIGYETVPERRDAACNRPGGCPYPTTRHPESVAPMC